MKTSSQHAQRNSLLMYQMRGDLLLKVALIFLVQASAITRTQNLARATGAPPTAQGIKPDLKLFLDQAGVLHVGSTGGATNLLGDPKASVAIYVRSEGGPEGAKVVQALTAVQRVYPETKTYISTY